MNLAASALKLPLSILYFNIYKHNDITYLYFSQVALEKFNHIIIKFDLHKCIFSICVTVLQFYNNGNSAFKIGSL